MYDKATSSAIITSNESKTGTVIFASFDDSNKLVSLSVVDNVEIKVGTTDVVPSDGFNATGNVRVYVWDSLKTMKPLFKTGK